MAGSIPFDIQPLHPTLVSKPFHRAGWVYEEEVDGWRIVAYTEGQNVRLVSRKGVAHTARFPGLVAAIAELPASPLVLDGEVAVYDERVVSRFDLLAEPTSGPVTYQFTVFMLHGKRVTASAVD